MRTSGDSGRLSPGLTPGPPQGAYSLAPIAADLSSLPRTTSLSAAIPSPTEPTASAATMHTKGPTPEHHDGRGLRIGIVHARWNPTIVESLLAGAKAKLQACGVHPSNMVVESVPGSWELPIAVQR